MRTALVPLTVALALVPAAAARADSVAYQAATLAYEGDGGADQVVVSRDGAALVFRAGPGQPLAAPGTCARRSASEVGCPAGSVTAVTVDLMGGNDTLTATLPDTPATSLTAHGGAGSDVLDASATSTGALFGDDGDDRLLPGRGSFDVTGGAGADELHGGPAGAQTRFLMGSAADGADQVLGGPGVDLVTYESRTAPLRLTEDGVADDGETGEGDNIAAAVEILVGGAGPDTLGGGPGPNALNAGAGDDIVMARDAGIDQVDCGAGNDTAVLDVPDTAKDCETQQRPQLDVLVSGLRSRASWEHLRQGLRFGVTTSAPARWTFVLLGARRGSRVLTRRSLPLAAGPRTVTLKPTSARLGARRRLTLRVRITAIAADGTKTLVIRRVRVSA
jgi:hemolysin type calcium-binding protein